ncbi:ATP-binding cassette domain-containing protein [Streptomyces sp. NPDC005840]|uniref:ATP-binding cassette domain-containing protein n=1 Tax=Streptomyces doudnae TaxID=3075536 RepID=A0ABD5EKH9_9ACTN|nr:MULTISPECIES: ATP-binding cassette domain-containing protein [unclassified Streptomyces]MDT0434793.1 ATP-binding cassette domain-containing protein [Streptomyces sp. DSM 41981]MYQ68852.1 ATP-binding cassette domain-containing protein [Streptomyces sp. SID4950]SCE49518.1 iron complex transport system ATP-binding protein [Streptomyces sp. SolWspMP-5a-2]
MTDVLRAEDVHVVRDGRPILQEVSLTVRAGEHWALLGANGAGKSTLLSLLGALVHPTRGTVDVLGRRLGRVDLRELRTFVGHVDPRHPLREPLRVHDVVLTGLTNSVAPVPRWRATAEQEARADRLIATLGLGDRRDARWPTLSQGQRGRTLIARALMPQPRLLLLDEPATGLDLPGREQLIGALDALREEHPDLATVLVTHHLEELPPGTSHAMLLRDGRVLAQGAVDGVLTGDRVGACFDLPLALDRHEGRWSVRIRRRG